MPSDDRPSRVPRMLQAILLLGVVGVGAELLLIEHDEDFDQRIPLLGLGATALALVWHAWRGGRLARLVFVAASLGLGACGAYGVYLHYASNAEFQLELDPALSGWGLVSAALRAKSPPALAPASLILLALIGLVSTCGEKPRP